VPGGVSVPGFGQAPASAPRREKARKHASQSAYAIRPAGTSGPDWFYPATGLVTFATLVLAAMAVAGSGSITRSIPAPVRLSSDPGRTGEHTRRGQQRYGC
jgi:hypothetical protein